MSAANELTVALLRQFIEHHPNPVLACFSDGSIDEELINRLAQVDRALAIRHSELFLPLDHFDLVSGCYQQRASQNTIQMRHQGLVKLTYVPLPALRRVLVYLQPVSETDEVVRIMAKKLREAENRSSLAELVGEFGVFNRGHFKKQLELAVHGVQKGLSSTLGVILLDINKFKQINDSISHAAGDEALKKVALATKEAVRTQDIVARLGGDEFAVVIFNTKGTSAADLLEEIALRIRENLSQPAQLGDVRWPIEVSIGGTLYRGEEGVTAETLLDRADKAMYCNKSPAHESENLVFWEIMTAQKPK